MRGGEPLRIRRRTRFSHLDQAGGRRSGPRRTRGNSRARSSRAQGMVCRLCNRSAGTAAQVVSPRKTTTRRSCCGTVRSRRPASTISPRPAALMLPIGPTGGSSASRSSLGSSMPSPGACRSRNDSKTNLPDTHLSKTHTNVGLQRVLILASRRRAMPRSVAAPVPRAHGEVAVRASFVVVSWLLLVFVISVGAGLGLA